MDLRLAKQTLSVILNSCLDPLLYVLALIATDSSTHPNKLEPVIPITPHETTLKGVMWVCQCHKPPMTGNGEHDIPTIDG